MKAFILAAGLGTRLGNLTTDKPKALVEVAGKPMIRHLLEKLTKEGFKEILINIHHFGDKVSAYLVQQSFPGLSISVSDERALLLDTGGAVKKAAAFFEGKEPVLVHNVDILTNYDLAGAVENHKKSKATVTLLVNRRITSRKLLFNKKMKLAGWKNLQTGEVIWNQMPVKQPVETAYSGIYVASPSFPSLLDKQKQVFPVVPEWLRIAVSHPVYGVIQNGWWFDLGTQEKIRKAESKMFQIL